MMFVSGWRVAVGVVLGCASIAAAGAPTATVKQPGKSTACSVRGTTARLQVRCPNGTVAELLAALRQATGLRSEYPRELGAARASVVTARAAPLQQVLGSALAAYNFATWKDPASPSVTWLRIVGLRHPTDGAEETVVYQPMITPHPEAVSTPDGGLAVPSDEAEMARVRESFAASVKPGPGLRPVPSGPALGAPR